MQVTNEEGFILYLCSFLLQATVSETITILSPTEAHKIYPSAPISPTENLINPIENESVEK